MTVASMGFRYQKCVNDKEEYVVSTIPWFYTQDAVVKDFQVADGTMQTWEDDISLINRWKATGEKDQTIELVPEAEEVGIIVDITSPRLRNFEIAVPNRKVGVYFSKVGNAYDVLRQKSLDTLGRKNPETADYIKFLASKGKKNASETKYLAVLDDPSTPEGIAFVGPTYDYKGISAYSIFGFRPNHYKIILGMADELGIKTDEGLDAIREYIVLHEITHLFGVHTEEGVGKLLAEYYGKKAKEGGKKGKLYAAIEKEAKAYIDAGRQIDIEQGLNLESLTSKLFAEAKGKGLTDERAIEYIARELSKDAKKSGKGNKAKYFAKEADVESDSESDEGEGSTSSQEGGE